MKSVVMFTQGWQTAACWSFRQGEMHCKKRTLNPASMEDSLLCLATLPSEPLLWKNLYLFFSLLYSPLLFSHLPSTSLLSSPHLSPPLSSLFLSPAFLPPLLSTPLLSLSPPSSFLSSPHLSSLFWRIYTNCYDACAKTLPILQHSTHLSENK